MINKSNLYYYLFAMKNPNQIDHLNRERIAVLINALPRHPQQDPTYRFLRSFTTVYRCTVVVHYTCKLTRCIMRKYTRYTICIRFKMDIRYIYDKIYNIRYIYIYIYEVKIANKVYIRNMKIVKLHNSDPYVPE